MAKRHVVGETWTDGITTGRIRAIASHWDIDGVLVVLVKLDGSGWMTQEVTDHDTTAVTAYIGPDEEKALQTWMDKAFGVNIF